MISHSHVGITDFPRAFSFYSAVMTCLGHELKFSEPEKSWAAWKPADAARPLFLIGKPYDGNSAAAGNGQMVALLASSRLVVDRCHALALEHGGMSEGAPGLRPQYHPNYYGAYFRDPDGNKLCVCCHDPLAAP
jgi:catechol 2,3-dioxygenase-like lactoylglutathione lyase family enzyme